LNVIFRRCLADFRTAVLSNVFGFLFVKTNSSDRGIVS